MVKLKNKVVITITCDEFFVADSLREIANTIENSELEYCEMRKFEGEHYTAGLHEIKNHPEEVK